MPKSFVRTSDVYFMPDSFIPIIAISTLNTRYISIFADAAIDDERRYVSIAEGSAAGLCDMSICMSPRITSVPTAVHEMKWIMIHQLPEE